MPPEPRRAVIIDPAFLGDVVFDGPLARALKGQGAYVGLVVRPPADVIARRMAGVDRVHVFDKRGRHRGLAGLREVARELAEEGYDLALIPHPSLRSSMLAALAGIPSRVGTSPFPARLLLTDRVAPRPGATFVEDRLALVGGADPALAGTLAAHVASPGAPPRRARVGLALGAHWATKRWPPERASELAAALDPTRVQLVLLGAEWERPLYAALARSPALAAAEDAVGLSLDAMVDRIATLDALIGGDTGPLHIARALGVPAVALFGPTPEQRHAFTARDAVLTVPLPCRPCSAHGDDRCPEGHHRCLRDLSGAQVHVALLEVLPSD